MAGTVAKLVYPNISDAGTNFVNHNIATNYNNMEEDVIVEQLNDESFSKRSEILEKLRTSVRRNGGKLPYANQTAIFSGLNLALEDRNWDVRLQCIQLLHELIPQFGPNLDACMHVILPRLVANIGDSKITVRRAVIQTIHVYMKHTDNVQPVLRALVQHGLESNDMKTRKEAIVSLPMVFTPEFAQENFYDIAQSLAKRLLDSTSGDDNLQQVAIISLEKIRNLVGDAVFNQYVQKLSAPLRKYYFKLTGREESIKQDDKPSSAKISDSSRNTPFSFNSGSNSNHKKINSNTAEQTNPTTEQNVVNKPVPAPRYYSTPSNNTYEFGIIPSHVMSKLEDQSNFRTRAQAVEDLKKIIKDLEDVHELLPHVLQFISFLNNLLDDSNFKITTVTLEILGLLVEKLSYGVKPFVKPLISAITKRMGDNKIVVRQAIMKVTVQLMQILSPKPVLAVISDNLSHRNSRVRQETLNIIIASLLTFPSYDFDLGPLCQTIAHTLIDPKRQVRQAAFECFAVLAQAMGAGKLGPLAQAVDSVELSYDGDGAMAAVQARLARRQLPKLNADGLVEYATPIPSSATLNRGHPSTGHGADIEWILAASGSVGNSARSARSDYMELESVTSSARSTPANFFESHSQGPTPRRFLSAGRGKSRLPWEEAGEETNQTGEQHPSSAPVKQPWSSKSDGSNPPPLKPRTTWGGEEMTNGLNGEGRRGLKHKPHSIGGTINSQDQSPEPGSYKQIYLNKNKRQSDGQPFSVYNPNKDGDDSGRGYSSTLSTPRDSGFSNTWPDAKMFDDTKPMTKRKLDPIAVADGGGYSAERYDNDDSRVKDKDSAPIPMKASLARGGSSKRKVPPIPVSQTSREDSHDSARDSAFNEDVMDHEEMLSSLRQIRNSATKKKAEKIFERLEKQQKVNLSSRSPSPHHSDSLNESGVFSQYSALQSNVDESDFVETAKRRSNRKSESPFETKPRLARKASLKSPKAEDAVDGSKGAPQRTDSYGQIDFKPIGGVTFRENHKSDVQIVGKGYGDDSQHGEAGSKQTATNGSKARERRRTTKSMLSPLGMASMYSHGAVDMDDDKVPDGVIGKGMFDVSPSSSDHHSSSTPEKRDRRTSRGNDSDHRDLPKGVYGVGVRQNSLDKQSSEEASDDLEEEDDMSTISFSKTTRERMVQKVQQKQEEAEQKRLEREREKERKQHEAEEKRRKREEERQLERERQQEKLRRLSNTTDQIQEAMGLTISGNAQSNKPPTGKPPSAGNTPAKRTKSSPDGTPASTDRKWTPNSGGTSPLSQSRTSEPDSLEDLKPLNNPEAALRDAIKYLGQADWEGKLDGLTFIRRLVLHHQQVLTTQLHTVTVAVIQEVKNLRSQVSRLAIVCLGDMFLCLKRGMDTDLDMTAKVLLAKNGESNGFIRNDAEKTLQNMVESVTPQRAMVALVAGGAAHRNVAVKKCTAQYLAALVDKMGPGRVLSGVKDITDKILPTAANFMLEGSQDIRYYGQKILYTLMSHQDFDKMMVKYVPATTLRNIQDKLDNLKKKGLGDPPAENLSARARRSGQGSRSGTSTRGSSASSVTDSLPASTPSNKKRPVRTDEATQEEIKEMCAQMGASDWRERHKGITKLQEMVDNNPNVVGANIVKIFDKFSMCVKDSNSKVNLFALQVLLEITPVLAEHMSPVVNMLVPNVANNLSSKNKDIHDTGSEILDAFTDNLDGAVLLQPFASQAQSGNARIKPDMIMRVADIVQIVYSRKQKQVVLHVLPLLWYLLGQSSGSGAVPGSTGNIRTSTAYLVSVLYQRMGEALLDHASSQLNARNVQQLQDMIAETANS